MHKRHLIWVLSLVCGAGSGYGLTGARFPGDGRQAGPVPAATAGPGGAVSGQLQPALDGLQKTVSTLKIEKWKGGTVREEAAAYLHSITQDVESTLPPMLVEADKSSGALTALLPVSRNVNALYDVLLRVVDASRVVAPADQVTILMQAQVDLEKARRDLDMHIVDLAAAQEKQVAVLQTNLKTQAAPVCPVVAAPVEKPAPPKKRVVKKKPAVQPAKPATSGTDKPKP